MISVSISVTGIVEGCAALVSPLPRLIAQKGVHSSILVAVCTDTFTMQDKQGPDSCQGRHSAVRTRPQLNSSCIQGIILDTHAGCSLFEVRLTHAGRGFTRGVRGGGVDALRCCNGPRKWSFRYSTDIGTGTRLRVLSGFYIQTIHACHLLLLLRLSWFLVQSVGTRLFPLTASSKVC